MRSSASHAMRKKAIAAPFYAIAAPRNGAAKRASRRRTRKKCVSTEFRRSRMDRIRVISRISANVGCGPSAPNPTRNVPLTMA